MNISYLPSIINISHNMFNTIKCHLCIWLCSALCGELHGFMPIELEAVEQPTVLLELTCFSCIIFLGAPFLTFYLAF